MSYKPTNTNDYLGKQVIINSDRLLFNAKDDSILLFSDKAIGLSTKGSIHFDTSNSKKSKIVINTPNIYLGLKSDKNLPTEPAILGDELDDWLGGVNGLLDVLDGIINDIIYKVSYTAPGGFTGPNPANESSFSTRRKQIDALRNNIKYIKSKTTKLV
tara:strand:+ start:641 stop:1114 length:474 start_codon:yes stop_codon:yes gene_type:complete